jgi:dUTP pyrophosphatase
MDCEEDLIPEDSGMLVSASRMIQTKINRTYREVTFSLETFDACPPQRATEGSVGFDLFSTVRVELGVGEKHLIDTGVQLHFPSLECYAKIESRSGLACKHGVSVVGSGVIDPDYQETVKVVLTNSGAVSYSIAHGERIAQLIFFPCHRVILRPKIGILPFKTKEKKRCGGFGSTGKK